MYNLFIFLGIFNLTIDGKINISEWMRFIWTFLQQKLHEIFVLENYAKQHSTCVNKLSLSYDCCAIILL